jgi:predicted CoA-binding protein
VTPDALQALLRNARTVAVVGLSPNAARPSHTVCRYLQRVGYRIVPVNPFHTDILGERCYPSLAAAARDHTIDIVDVFRRSEYAGAVVDEAIALRPRLIWLQQGVIDAAAAARAGAAGIPCVMDRCLAVDHERLFTPATSSHLESR